MPPGGGAHHSRTQLRCHFGDGRGRFRTGSVQHRGNFGIHRDNFGIHRSNFVRIGPIPAEDPSVSFCHQDLSLSGPKPEKIHPSAAERLGQRLRSVFAARLPRNVLMRPRYAPSRFVTVLLHTLFDRLTFFSSRITGVELNCSRHSFRSP